MAGVFGQTSGPFGSSSGFGNTFSSTQNSFAPNSLGPPSPGFPTQCLIFGGGSTELFGASPSSSTPASTPSFASGLVFGSNSNSSRSPFTLNSSRNTTFPNLQTQASIFRESSTGIFGPTVSSPASSPSLIFGQTPGSLGSSSLFGIKSDANQNPFASNTVGSSTFSGLPAQSSSFSGTSTVLFGRTSSSLLGSSATFSSGIASSAAFGSSAVGPGNSTSNNAFALKPLGSSLASVSPTISANFSYTSTGFHGATGSVNPFATSSSTVSTSIYSGGTGSRAQTTGTKITPYSHTIIKEGERNCKLISISAMPTYESKSHEELRWEAHELKSGGKQNSESNYSLGIGSVLNNQQQTFSLPSLTNSVTPTSPSFTASRSSSIFTPLASIETTRPASPNTNTSIFQPLHFSSPTPLPNSGLFKNQAPVFNASEYGHSVLKLDPIGSLGSWSSSSDQSLLNHKQLTQHVGIWYNHQPGVTSHSLANQSPSTTSGHNQFRLNNVFVQPAIAAVPSVGIGLDPTNPAQSAATTPAFSTGDSVSVSVFPDLGQPNPSQLFFPTGKATDNIVAVKDPFGSQTAASHPSTSQLDGPSVVQHGISSMPVPGKPTIGRVSSFLTTRHSSLKPLSVHVRKYRPKTDALKVPFFNLTEETHSIQKACPFPIPRENPRSVFSTSMEQTHGVATKSDASQLINASSSSYEDDKPDQQNAKNDESTDTMLLMPKLKRSDYYTQPNIHELATKESLEPGFCSHVKGFVVGRHGYGWVKFEGETDVRGLDLDTLIHFNEREVIVYADDREKPPVGQGLNKLAEVTLLNIRCIDKKTGKDYDNKKMVDKYTEKLRKAAEEQDAEFVSFDPVKGEWRFRVKHF